MLSFLASLPSQSIDTSLGGPGATTHPGCTIRERMKAGTMADKSNLQMIQEQAKKEGRKLYEAPKAKKAAAKKADTKD